MRVIKESELRKYVQISIRISSRMDTWLAGKVGKENSKAGIIRSLIEREMAREASALLTNMFDAATAELTADDRRDRELLTGALANPSSP